MSKPSPKNPPSGGVWRRENGRLTKVEEPLVASRQERVGGPGIPVPPADEDTPETTKPSRLFGKKGAKPSKED